MSVYDCQLRSSNLVTVSATVGVESRPDSEHRHPPQWPFTDEINASPMPGHVTFLKPDLIPRLSAACRSSRAYGRRPAAAVPVRARVPTNLNVASLRLRRWLDGQACQFERSPAPASPAIKIARAVVCAMTVAKLTNLIG